jgi:hypothetical protein
MSCAHSTGLIRDHAYTRQPSRAYGHTQTGVYTRIVSVIQAHFCHMTAVLCVCAAAEGVHCTRARIVLIVTWECVRARNQPSQYCVVITKNNNHASRRPIDMASDQLLVDVSPSTANGVTAASTTATTKSNVHVTGACVLVV